MGKYGWATKAMFSFRTKEATYGAVVTAGAGNFIQVKGAKIKVEWPDIVADDGDMITGSEYPTEQEIQEADVRITITEERAHPAFVGAALALAAGSNTVTQDGIETAYQHKAVPMTAGTAPISINGVILVGGVQRLCKGLFAESVKISAAKDGYVSCEVVLHGNGTRASNADAFLTAPSESWFKARNIRAFLESGADIAIDVTPVQGAENISSATPVDLSTRFRSFEFSWSVNPEKQLDNLGVDHGIRRASLKFQATYNDGTEIDHYLNQDNLAFEINLDSGSLIDPQGAFKYGLILLFPRGRLKAAPLPPADENGLLLADYEFLLMDDGTNPHFLAFTYNAIPAYIA